jgi:TetR/AcrR family fatty acid metabolism transcriptional regulator
MREFFIPNVELKFEKIPVKRDILHAASKLMSENGFAGSSMSKIASEANTTETTIYQYFKGKDELLYSIVEQDVEDGFVFMNEHLQGISSPDEKLSKLIWAHLRYNDLNQEYMKWVLLDCRPNNNFYKSRAYKLLRKYTGSYLQILEEGIGTGTFRSDVNPRLARDIILGLLDYEAYTVLVTKEIADSVKDHKAIMALIRRMLYGKEKVKDSSLLRRQRIQRAAVRLFAEKGYAGATISEIACLAGISDGSVYECFKNKEDILLSIPEDYFERHLNQLEETFNIRSTEKKLKRFIQDHFRLYLDDHNFLKVYLVLIQLNRRFYKSRAYESLRKYIKVFEDLIQEGIDECAFASDCNVRICRNMFLGAFTHMNLRWFVAPRKTNVDILSEINAASNLFLDAFRNDSSNGK